MNLISSNPFQRLIVIKGIDEVPSGFFLVDSLDQASHFTSEAACASDKPGY